MGAKNEPVVVRLRFGKTFVMQPNPAKADKYNFWNTMGKCFMLFFSDGMFAP